MNATAIFRVIVRSVRTPIQLALNTVAESGVIVVSGGTLMDTATTSRWRGGRFILSKEGKLFGVSDAEVVLNFQNERILVHFIKAALDDKAKIIVARENFHPLRKVSGKQSAFDPVGAGPIDVDELLIVPAYGRGSQKPDT